MNVRRAAFSGELGTKPAGPGACQLRNYARKGFRDWSAHIENVHIEIKLLAHFKHTPVEVCGPKHKRSRRVGQSARPAFPLGRKEAGKVSRAPQQFAKCAAQDISGFVCGKYDSVKSAKSESLRTYF